MRSGFIAIDLLHHDHLLEAALPLHPQLMKPKTVPGLVFLNFITASEFRRLVELQIIT